MAKKISLSGTIKPNPSPVADDAVNEVGGVRYTPDGGKHPNVPTTSAEMDEVFPLVKADVFDTADANDGTENGEQDSFKMPPFANGVDSRKRRGY
jgi:hypothetical protein